MWTNHHVDFFQKKKAQEEKISKRNLSSLSRKSGQEEMVGFVLIMILVMVILLIVLGFVLTGKKGIEEKDYQLDSFLESALQITTNCSMNGKILTLKDMVPQCVTKQKCENTNEDICKRMETIFRGAINQSFNPGKESYVKSFSLNIYKIDGEQKETVTSISEGSQTKTSRVGWSEFIKGKNYQIYLKNYY